MIVKTHSWNNIFQWIQRYAYEPFKDINIAISNGWLNVLLEILHLKLKRKQ